MVCYILVLHVHNDGAQEVNIPLGFYFLLWRVMGVFVAGAGRARMKLLGWGVTVTTRETKGGSFVYVNRHINHLFGMSTATVRQDLFVRGDVDVVVQ